MPLSITHQFVSGIIDDPVAAAAGKTLPSHWNAGHVVTGSLSGTQVSNIPAGSITATDVQAAINQLAGLIPVVGPGTDPLYLTRGLDISVINPNDVGDLGGHTFMEAEHIGVTLEDNRSIEPGFKDQFGLFLEMFAQHGDNSFTLLNQSKTTYFPLSLRFTSNAAGQRFLVERVLNAFGMGDCFIESTFAYFSSGPGAGDEGQSITPTNAFMSQTESLSTGQVTSVTRAAGNTTITQDVARSRLSQTVTVASTVGINVGDWYVVNQQLPAGQYDAMAIQIEQVGAGTITAKFRMSCPSGTTLTPALVLGVTSMPEAGQLRVLVNLSGAVYNTGTIVSSLGAQLNGAGNVFADNMVGGNALNIGAITLTKDNYSGFPFSDAHVTLKSWYELKAVFPAAVVVHSYSQAGDQAYHPDVGWPTTFEIRPAVRILWMVSPNIFVCETTTTVWSIGDNIECAICPYPDVSGAAVRQGVYTPGGTRRTLFEVSNRGVRAFSTGLAVQWYRQADIPSGGDTFGFTEGIHVSGCVTGITADDCSGNAFNIADSFNQHAGADYQPGLSWGNQFRITMNKYRGVSMGVPGSLVDGEIYVAAQGRGDPENVEDATMQMVKFVASWLKLTPSNNTVTKPYIVLDTVVWKRVNDADLPSYLGVDAGPTQTLDFFGAPKFAFATNQAGFGGNKFIQHVSSQITCANGDNVTIFPTGTFTLIIGPTAAFNIQRISVTAWGGSIAGDGDVLMLFNTTANAMTIMNEAVVGTNAIRTLTGADVTLRAGTSFATLIYSSTIQRWILVSTN